MKRKCNFIALFKAKYEMFKIRRAYKEHLIFVALSGIGDICYCFSFLEAIKQNSHKKVLVITGLYTAELMKYYESIDDIIVLNKSQVEMFKLLMKKYENRPVFNENSRKRGVYFCNALSENVYNTLNKTSKNYIDILGELAAGNASDASVTYPVVPKVDLERLGFAELEKTAVINPYSNSLTIENRCLFEKIVCALRDKGYKIYTNVIGSQEPLPGTIALKCSLQELYHITKRAGIFVSIRSGVVDFSIGNGGNFIVLYNDEKTPWFRKAYGLDGWKTESNICEFDCKEETAVIEKINELC